MSHWTVYILLCKDGTLYTGITNDLDKRVAAHNKGTAARYTRGSHRRPVRVAWTEAYATKGMALKREAAIKRLSRQTKCKLIEKGSHES